MRPYSSTIPLPIQTNKKEKKGMNPFKKIIHKTSSVLLVTGLWTFSEVKHGHEASWYIGCQNL